jgi:hypothetical protein
VRGSARKNVAPRAPSRAPEPDELRRIVAVRWALVPQFPTGDPPPWSPRHSPGAQTPGRVPLAPRREHISERVEIRGRSTDVTPGEPELTVAVPTSLDDAHSAVRVLQKVLRGAKPSGDPPNSSVEKKLSAIAMNDEPPTDLMSRRPT